MASNMIKNKRIVCLMAGILIAGISMAQRANPPSEERPWLWWYWLGSEVTPEGIQQHLDAFHRAGFGGVSVSATYEVDGHKAQSIPFMSKRWTDMLEYTASTGRKLGMGTDVALASAWPFGGPNVTPAMAAQKLSGGKLLSATGGEVVNLPVYKIGSKTLLALMAFSDPVSGDRAGSRESGGGGAGDDAGEMSRRKSRSLDLTNDVDGNGVLHFTFPSGLWEVYSLFSEPTGQRVKRSGVGGEGLVLDHFNANAVEKYLKRFDSLFSGPSHLRATFNDSYEVYGADCTPRILEEFEKRRGYDFRKYLADWYSPENTDTKQRLVCDYRETVADLLLDDFIVPWNKWAHAHGVKTVEQAHGSPSNWLDLYAGCDIPQTESFGASIFGIPGVSQDKDYPVESFGRPDKLLMKFASSAGNFTGKALVSSETATWLGNHFKVALSQVKPQVDELFVSGINHLMMTCATYSPFDLPFPGRLFYPASNFGHNSGMFPFFPEFTQYVANCQRVLQHSGPDNEVLLYFPVHDIWSDYSGNDAGHLAMMAVHNPQQWFYSSDFGGVARKLRNEGFDFDYVSDRQISGCHADGGRIVNSAGISYKAIVIPGCKRMPIPTLRNILQLARQGVPVIFAYHLIRDVPGLYQVEQRKQELVEINRRLREASSVSVSSDFCGALGRAGLRKEVFGNLGLEYIRKKDSTGYVYFIANQQTNFSAGWITMPEDFGTAECYDPLSGRTGALQRDGRRIYLELQSGQSAFVRLVGSRPDRAWHYFEEKRSAVLDGPWKIRFLEGHPALPHNYQTNELQSWTLSGDSMARYFSGTAEYETTFGLESSRRQGEVFQLDLGEVHEVADVSVNGHDLGVYWCYPYVVNVPADLLKRKGNVLRIRVTNLDANRMIWMDRQKIPWKNFFFLDITYSDFNASGWTPLASGLLGTVKLKTGRERPNAPGTGDAARTGASAQAQIAVNFDFLNPALPMDVRVRHLVNQMTLEEKVGQLVYDAPAIGRLKVPAYNWWNEGLHGVARAGQATVFPQAIAMAASFDKHLMRRVGDAISSEARAKNNAFLKQGKHGIYQGLTFWSPNINIFRDPRWGRGQETYGEDPFLTSAMAVSYIRGMQGDDPHYLKTVATAKHFAVHSGPEPLRHEFNAQPGPKDLWETYLPAFRAAVQMGGVQSVMCAYNRFMGDACCGSSTLLQEILRDKWHFKGYVVSDCWAIKDFWQTHKVASDPTSAAVMALRAGTDLNCGVTYPYLVDAVRKGMVEEKLVDQAVTRLFKERFALGLFDPVDKVPYRRIPFSSVDSKPHREVALQMARESIVLLKNDRHILPLSKNIRKIAVIGPLADDEETLWADYSGYNKNGVTLLKGIKEKLPRARVRYVTGCELAPGFPQVEPIPASFLYSDSTGGTHGVGAEYFSNASLSGKPAFVKKDSSVDFLWWDRSPDPRLSADSFSVRWQGYVRVPETGEIALGGEGFNSYRLWINDSLKVDFASVHHPQKEFHLYQVHRGQWIKIKIEYQHHTVNHALMRLLWSRPVTAATTQRALDAAREADVVILAMGLNQNLEGEEMDLSVPGFSGGDRTDLELPAPQEELLRKIQATGKPTVLVLLNGGPVSVPWEKDHIDGIVEGWYDGQSAGTALADVLFGDYNPAGRMPVTVYRSVEQLPSFEDYGMKGKTYRYFKGSPLYEFGYGLSYTHFRYSGLRLSQQIATGDSVEVRLVVANQGDCDGDEVVQLYVRHEDGDADQPIRSLKGFQRIHLKKGEKREVRFLLDGESLSTVLADGRRVVAPGVVAISVGGSQPDELSLQKGAAVTARMRLKGAIITLP